MESQQQHRVFSRIDLFAGLPEAEMRALAQTAIPRTFEAGESLFFEGEDCQGIWILTAGLVKIVKATPTGRQIVLGMQQAPATVAEVPVFDGGPYPATVTATETTTAMLILTRDFQQCCLRNPAMTLRFLHLFGGRLRHLVTLVERITFGSIRQRLAIELLSFSDQSGSDTFLLPETHEDLAVRLGTVREVVSRNLGRFQSEGMLRIQRREVEILSRSALEAEAATQL
jgi:CRP/FNR family transcriptional regulator